MACPRAPHQTGLPGKRGLRPAFARTNLIHSGALQAGFVGPSVTAHDPSSLAVQPGGLAARGPTWARARLSVCWSLGSTLEKEHLPGPE